MVMEMPVPLDRREFPGQVFSHKILDTDQRRLGIGGLKQQALKNFVRNAFAIVMERTTWCPVCHHVRRLNMNLVTDSWTCWFPTHGFLGSHSTTSNGNHGDNG
jgi:hypothetical protein